ncbi:cytochrome P450 [Aspergillus brunneoviolaceus CBS 621.78]|uniref:Cytochrome P450 n=1 Tax=Aspergillus brunneoviolaceus CBS 621.78 TaxID=1450534 RepID=A0ACD1GPA8_9EURO|nr:cytochrome P450 [Aspergillus brunneoviolaceus CBS 621.78]RAH51118.1 cytochrome P450 [Aspergillus brunneoviolaceus CBS 621.78]
MRRTWKGRIRLPLPPGPPRKLFLGNLRDLPKHGCKQWEHWYKHKALYGPISSVVAPNQTIIILNDPEIAVELFEKRSKNYSARPHAAFCKDLMKWDRLLALQGNLKEVREKRKLISSLIGSNRAIESSSTVQELEVRRFLWRTLQQPQELLDHIRREAGAVILKLTYGYVVEPKGRDAFIELADLSGSQFAKATEPGKWLVDTLPILKYVPSWFPGAEFQRLAKEWDGVLTALGGKPYTFAKKNYSRGVDKTSHVARHLATFGSKLTPHDEYLIQWSAADLYSGGTDTAFSSISEFFLAMALNPDIQEKAQEELDRVVGALQEVLRWHQVAPLALPREAAEEDVYGGYRIPRGAFLIPNIWGWLHDPQAYKDPMSFNPDRYLAGEGRTPEPDPRRFCFGTGRRICPGRFLAESSVYLMIAHSLAVFCIRKQTTSDGREIEPLVKPRSADHEALIRSIDEADVYYVGNSKDLDAIEM